MYQGLSVGVVIPAYNEEKRIGPTLRRVPWFVDSVVVVDDCSTDGTHAAARSCPDRRVRVIRHACNLGVGKAILSGYRDLRAEGLQVAVVMAGDGQMDPEDLPSLLDPLVRGVADYVKGNRLSHPSVVSVMPKLRLVGNLGLSFLTRFSSGYTRILDAQCGYTAVSLAVLDRLDFDRIYPRYGFPNDLLAHLHSVRARLEQVTVRPIYDGEESGINPLLAVIPMSYVLARSGLMRMGREAGMGRRRAVGGPML